MNKLDYIKTIYMHLKIKNQKKEIWSILEGEDFLPISNNCLVNIETIMFVLPSMMRFSGGCTSIIRLASYLSKIGFQIKYGICGGQSKKEFIEAAKQNLSDFTGEVIERRELDNYAADIVIATSWHSVYTVKKLKGYKMYFVQDYEPYFYNYDERYLLAKKTYELGLHMVSLGIWNKREIMKNIQNTDILIDSIDFPYEKKEYKSIKRNYLEYPYKKKIVMAVYIKAAGKRIPNIIEYMLLNVKNKFLENGIRLELLFYGEIKKYNLSCGKNLGKLNQKELENLYGKSDFGMSASMTNISLVPYEMMATGLPIIEFKDGTFPCFFDDKSAILTSYNYLDLYEKMMESILEPKKLEAMTQRAQTYLEHLSWENSSKQFSEIIRTTGERKTC